MDIEWEKIDGYSEGMSAEEKLALLEKQATKPRSATSDDGSPNTQPTDESKPAPAISKQGEKTIDKRQFDKVASELAALKKRLRDQMSHEEQKELDRQQAQEEMERELEALRKEKTISSHKASLLALGYDDQLASNTADAIVDGDFDAVFSNMKKYNTNFEKSLRATILKETPTPPAGNPTDDKDQDPFIEAFKKG